MDRCPNVRYGLLSVVWKRIVRTGQVKLMGFGSRLLLAGLLLSTAAAAVARTFTPVGATNGLDARVVVSMLVDRDGFLWVGSREGLFRYDGYDTLAYLPDTTDPDAISDIDIRHIYEDSSGNIWVGTNTGGLNRLDPDTGKFVHYRHDSSDPGSLADDSVYGIVEGPDGALWVGTQKGLGRLDRATGRFELFVHDPNDPGSLPHDWTYRLYFGPGGTFWIGTIGGGIARWNPVAGNFSRFDIAALTGGPEGRNDVFAILEEGSGTVWLGTREGLVRLDPASNRAEAVDLGEQSGYRPVITSMLADREGRLWLGTMVRGVLIVDPETAEWQPASHLSLGAAGYLPAQPQMSMVTIGDQLFVGTWGSGVYRAPLAEIPFKLLNHATSDSLRNKTISAVMAGDAPGIPWLGSFGGGPQLADVRRGTVAAVPDEASELADSGVMSMARTGAGRFFAATANGVFEFDAQGRQLVHFEHDPGNTAGLGAGYAIALLPAGDNLWIGMGGSGLQYLDTDTLAFETYRHDPAEPNSLSGDFITSLLDDRENYLWVGTRSNGLNRCRIQPWSCERFTGRGGAENGLSHFRVTSLFRDRRGRLWVGTDGGGLNLVLQDDSTGSVTGFRYWTRQDGLLNDRIMAIQEDLDESLWLSTRHGLVRINPATGAVVNFVSASGLPVSHFNTNAAAADEDFIYFGSVDGLLSFAKGSLLAAREEADVRITALRHAAPGQAQARAALDGGELRLPYGDVIAIEMASLDYSESRHEYAYRLQPKDPWTGLGAQRQVILHGLNPGGYEIQVRGRDVYGLWAESEALRLVIIPPFWMTVWFRILVVLSLAALAVAWFLARERRLNRRAEELRRLSEKREHALEEQLGSQAELKVLTPRQKEILQLIAEGYSTKEIADLLDVSIKTVEAHRSNLMERLDIRDIAGLVRLAIRTRLVSPHD